MAYRFDGTNDVVTSLEAHGWGLAWFEQKRNPAGESSWTQHLIMDGFDRKNPGGVTFSQLHALTSADVDGDGIQDIITGRRMFAHLDSFNDPDPRGDAHALRRRGRLHVPDRGGLLRGERRGDGDHPAGSVRGGRAARAVSALDRMGFARGAC